MRLTDEEKLAVEKTFAMTELRDWTWTCNYLDACSKDGMLSEKYAEFFGQDACFKWPDLGFDADLDEAKAFRLMLLATFHELYGKV